LFAGDWVVGENVLGEKLGGEGGNGGEIRRGGKGGYDLKRQQR